MVIGALGKGKGKGKNGGKYDWGKEQERAQGTSLATPGGPRSTLGRCTVTVERHSRQRKCEINVRSRTSLSGKWSTGQEIL